MIAPSLRKIEAELMALATEDHPIDHEAVMVAARRIGAQAEMLEQGLSE